MHDLHYPGHLTALNSICYSICFLSLYDNGSPLYCRLFKPVKSDVPAENPKHFMKIKFLHKGVDAINLPQPGFYLLGGGRGGKLPPPKVLLKKNLQLFQIKIFRDDDFKESVKVTNVQKCDFSQS